MSKLSDLPEELKAELNWIRFDLVRPPSDHLILVFKSEKKKSIELALAVYLEGEEEDDYSLNQVNGGELIEWIPDYWADVPLP